MNRIAVGTASWTDKSLIASKKFYPRGCSSAVEAGTTKQGLVEAGTRRPDMIIADLGLPDGDGIDFIREVRTWSGVPIIVLSAPAFMREKVAALDAGADDYLT